MDELDQQDWELFRLGDRAGIESIYRRHKDGIFNYCLHVTGYRSISEDLTQETFMRLMSQSASDTAIDDLKNWLFIVARNLALNHIKRTKRETSLDHIGDSLSDGCTPEQQQFLREILNELSAQERDLILLREQQGFSIRELAEILDVSSETIRIRLYRIRKRMFELGNR